MLRIRPFSAVRPVPNLAARVASLPYDVVTTDEARALAADNPLSFLHVVRSEIDLPAGTDPYSDAVYAKAAENFRRLQADRIIARDPSPNLYLYRLVREHRAQIGVVACCHVDDYRRNLIRRHELTRRDKEDDRTRHVLAINANAGPVFLAYRDDHAIDGLVRADVNHRPLYHFIARDGVTHTVWTVVDPAPYVDLFSRLPCAYIADGHHRAASAARAAEVRRQADRDRVARPGDREYDWFLCVLFPASQLTILPYNRTVRDFGALRSADVLARLAEVGCLTDTTDPRPERPGVFCVYMDRKWRRIEIAAEADAARDPVRSLDVSILQERVLGPIFGIGDPRTDRRIDFVGGIRGTSDLERRVNDGQAAVAFSVHATSIDQLLAVADAGLLMPPKSTWFEPKLRSGLLVHELD
jgi:uncharacterized protein (DUF1015 family)